MKHEWTQDNERWGCDASDHGPFCRLCVPLGLATQLKRGRTPLEIQRIAENLVRKVMYDLAGRRGFDTLLDELDENVAHGVMSDLIKIVVKELELET